MEETKQKTVTCNLQSPHFENIGNGTKQVEARVNRDKFATIRPGDTLEMHLESKEGLQKSLSRTLSKTLSKTVVRITHHVSFGAFLDQHLDVALPGMTYKDGVALYDGIYKGADKIKGVVACWFV